MPGGIDDAIFNQILEGLALKQYNLLLGAGHSYGVADRRGRTLPGGQGLAKELIKAFNLPVAPTEQAELARVYRSAGRTTTSVGQTRDDWLRDHFSKTKPPAWFAKLGTVPWKSMWTLNIDDAVESALPNKIRPIHYSDPPTGGSRDVIDLIHLHGMAASPERGLIFSLDEYRRSISTPRSWPIAFEERLSDEPFIVVGAALYHELDLNAALNRRARIVGPAYPSIAVMPNPTALDREDFADWNIEIYDGTSEEFFALLVERLSETRTRLNLAASTPSPYQVQFLEQWHLLGRERKSVYHEFLAGDEPEWSDVDEGLAVKRHLTASVVDLLAKGRPVVLDGEPFGGKSALSLLVGKALLDSGWSVYAFNDVSRPDENAVLQRLRDQPKTALIVERAGEFARELAAIAQRASEDGLPCALLCVDREGLSKRLVAANSFVHVQMPAELVEDEAVAIAESWKRAGTTDLGDYKSIRRRVAAFMGERHKPTVARFVSQFVYNDNLRDRVERDYRALKASDERAILLGAVVCSQVGRGGTIGIIAAAAGLSAREVELRLGRDSALSALIVASGTRVRARNRLYADLVLHAGPVAREIEPVLKGLCEAIAPQLNPLAISQKTWAHRLSVFLLDHEQLSDMIGRSRLQLFYESVSTSFGWNSRYWEQRALAASRDEEYSLARRFARAAVERYRDALSLNTFATVLFNDVESRYATDSREQVHRGFSEALEQINAARAVSPSDSEYPYVTFFSHALRYANWQLKTEGDLTYALRRQWNDWTDSSQHDLQLNSIDAQRLLDQFQVRWLQLAAV